MQNSFETIKKLPLEMALLLAKQEKLQRLLVIDDPDISGEFEMKSWDKLIDEGYISITPIVFEDYSKKGVNTYLCIVLDDISFTNTDNAVQVRGQILIGSNFDHLLMKNYELRLLSILETLEQTLNNHKFSAAGKLNIHGANSVSYSNFSFGYIVNFSIEEQQHEGVEI